MGKLVQALRRLGRSSGPSIGFGRASPTREPELGIIAVLGSADRTLARRAVEQGALGVLLGPGVKPGKDLGLPEEAPVGVHGPGEAGDFVVLGLSDPLTVAYASPDRDVVLRLEADPPERLLRALEALPVDALAVPGPEGEPSVEALLPCYHVARVRRPVLAFAPMKPGPGVLAALRDAGVSALAVELTSSTVGDLAALRQAIVELPPRRARGEPARAVPSVALSARTLEAGGVEPEEEDDEDRAR